MLGGFGSIPGALVGGLTIGVIELMSGAYLPPGFKDVAAYLVLLVVLAVSKTRSVAHALAYLAIFGLGAGLALQSYVNGKLGRSLGSAELAAAVWTLAMNDTGEPAKCIAIGTPRSIA